MVMYVECCKSKDKDSTYQVLKVDFGYRVATLFSVDKDLLCELCDVSPKTIYNMNVGDKLIIGRIVNDTKK